MMKPLKVDKRMLVDSFDYVEWVGKGEVFAGDDQYKDPVTIDYVRIDYQSGFSRDKTEAKHSVKAIIFCYASATTPFMNFKERSKVIIDGKEYVIETVVPCKEPHRNTLWSIELEVV